MLMLRWLVDADTRHADAFAFASLLMLRRRLMLRRALLQRDCSHA